MWARKRQKVSHPPDGSDQIHKYHDDYYRRNPYFPQTSRGRADLSNLVPSFDYSQRNGLSSCEMRQDLKSLWYKTAFGTLPPELLHSICELLGPDDVQAFRLVCRTFAVVGLEYLGTEAYLCCKQSSFKSLVELSKSSLSKNITTLHFMPDHFSRRYTLDEWFETEQYKARFLSQGVRHYLHVEGDALLRHPAWRRLLHLLGRRRPGYLQAAWSRFRQYYTEQIHLDRDKAQYNVLRSFFEKCPKLATVNFSNSGRAVQRLDLAFNDAMCSPSYCKDPVKGCRALVDVASAVALCGISVKSLTTGCLSLASFQSGTEDMEYISKAMKSLAGLALDLSYENGPATTTEIDGEVISTLLGSAPRLYHLILALPRFRITDFDVIIGCHTFLNLRSLHLEKFSTRMHHLLVFLTEWRSSLKYIRFRCVKLHDRTWDEFFKTISTRLLRLRSFILQGHLEEPNRRTLYQGFRVSRKSSILTHAKDKKVFMSFGLNDRYSNTTRAMH